MRINVKGFLKLLGQKIKIRLPEILTGVGLTAMGGAVATAIIRTPKANEQFREHKRRLEELPMTPQEEKREKMLIIGDLAKAYWPTALLFATGTASIICADGIHCKREASLAGLVGVLTAKAKDVADRIEAKYGKEEADKLIYGTKEIEEKEIKKNRKTGAETEITKIREVIDPDTAAKSFWFCIDDTNPIWPAQKTFTAEEASAQNGMVWHNLCEMEMSLNRRLQLEGNVLLNPVLKELHLPQIYGETARYDWIGWYYNVKDANPKYHNHISFGLDDPVNDKFKAGLERCVWIKLTPDGSIFEELKNANLVKALFERSE